ncbi:hypothetical protein FKP32DRAFT_1597588 [Trametes sanguinea]|nr:hypothetical protein FKP32DRAFT_1597588 [Trametes sanguinea]
MTSAVERLPSDVCERICHTLFCDPFPFRGHLHEHDGRRTVVSLAATCKQFYGPAVNVLWHTIPDIAALFCVLPRELYVKTPFHGVSLHMMVHGHCFAFISSRLLQSAELSRFFAYARRVKVIDSEYGARTPMGEWRAMPSVYDTLAVVLGPNKPLCPNLRTIRYERTNDSVVPFDVFRSLHILISPSLRGVTIVSRGHPTARRTSGFMAGGGPPLTAQHEESFTSLLAYVRDTVSNLSSLDLQVTAESDPILAAIDTTIMSFNHLVSLKLGGHTQSSWGDHVAVTPRMFAHIASLPHLQSLHISVDESSWTPDQLLQPSGFLFPSLRELIAAAPTLAQLCELLHAIMSPALDDLAVSCLHGASSSDISALITTVAGTKAWKDLRRLRLWVDNMPSSQSPRFGPPHSTPLDDEALLPLLNLPKLRHLSLRTSCPFDIDDMLLDKIAATWRNLVHLTLKMQSNWADAWARTNVESAGNGGRQSRPRATLLGIASVAFGCPDLEELDLEFTADTRTIPHFPRKASQLVTGPSRCCLNRLFVGKSPIDDPCAVAAFLSGLFPQLRDLHNSWPSAMNLFAREVEEGGENEEEEETYRWCWDSVPELIAGFVGIREEERRWKRRLSVQNGGAD